jgi:hypothetical protein
MITSESTSPSSLRNRQHFLGLRLSVAAFLVMTTLLMAGSGDAIDLMKLLDQKQRSFKRAGKPLCCCSHFIMHVRWFVSNWMASSVLCSVLCYCIT